MDRIADAVRERRGHHAHHHVDLVLVDEFLRHLDAGRGDVRIVTVDEIDRPVRDLSAVLIQVKLGRAAHRVAELRVDTRERQQLPELQLLTGGGAGRCARRYGGRSARGERRSGGGDEELSPRESIGVSALFSELVLTESAHETPSHHGERRKYGSGQDSRSKSVARPCPTPMHIVAMPYRPLRRSSSRSSVPARRAPDAAIGWPIAMAPPFGLVRSSGRPSARMHGITWAAKASFSSIASHSAGAMPVRSTSLRTAGIGPRPM